ALREQRDDFLHPMARATYAAALALGLLAQGRHDEARESLAAARTYYPTCPLLPRVEATLAAGRPEAPSPLSSPRVSEQRVSEVRAPNALRGNDRPRGARESPR